MISLKFGKAPYKAFIDDDKMKVMCKFMIEERSWFHDTLKESKLDIRDTNERGIHVAMKNK